MGLKELELAVSEEESQSKCFPVPIPLLLPSAFVAKFDRLFKFGFKKEFSLWPHLYAKVDHIQTSTQ